MIRRREFIALLGGTAAWPLAARAQQGAMPVVEFLHPGASEIGARDVAAFRKGLQETGYIEGQNVTTEYHWLEGQYGRLPAVNSDLTRRSVAVIAIPGSVVAARAAKAAMATTQSCSNTASFPARPPSNFEKGKLSYLTDRSHAENARMIFSRGWPCLRTT